MAASPAPVAPVLYRVLYGDGRMFPKISKELRKKVHARFNFHYVLEEIDIKQHRHKLNSHNTWSDCIERNITTRLEIWGDPAIEPRANFLVTSRGILIGPPLTLQEAVAFRRPGQQLWEKKAWPARPK